MADKANEEVANGIRDMIAKINQLRETNAELLEALQGVLTIADYMRWPQEHPAWVRARAAIAKAKGETR